MSWPVEKILEEALKLDAKDRALVIAELSRATDGVPHHSELEPGGGVSQGLVGVSEASGMTCASGCLDALPPPVALGGS